MDLGDRGPEAELSEQSALGGRRRSHRGRLLRPLYRALKRWQGLRGKPGVLASGTRWRSMDLDEREEAYSPSSCIGGDYGPFIARYRTMSAEARSRIQAWREYAYGPAPSHRLDLFTPQDVTGHAIPVLVFFHGGYWQELSKDESSFAAPALVGAGAALAAVDYTLAPDASITEIVDECRRAVGWLHQQADELGIDPRRIVVSGNSAGAHLAAMVALPGWQRAAGLPADLVRAAVLVSGIYDLAPLVGTSIDIPLGLTDAEVESMSPTRVALDGFPRSLVCWGEVETTEFKAQSWEFANGLTQAGTTCTVLEVPARNHFDVVLDLADPTADITRRVLSVL